MVFIGLGIAAVAAGCIFWISPLIIILVLLFFSLGIIFNRVAAKKKKAYPQTSWESEEDHGVCDVKDIGNTEQDAKEDGLPAFCSGCGKRTRPGDVFCSGCGKKLVER